MPELPEVETIVRDLRPHLLGRELERVDLLRDSVLRFPDPLSFRRNLAGRRVGAVGRRGKFIQISVGGNQDLIVHLGMTGTLTLEREAAELRPHTHLRIALGGDRELRFRDPRRFGRVLLGARQELEDAGVLPRLGAEPLDADFDVQGLGRQMRRSRRAVKLVLLDQAVVAGCGNIYADEACFGAGVRPDRRANRLSQARAELLLAQLPLVMGEAVRLRGSSFSDYRDGFGAKGEAFEQLRVYGRGGQPCLNCGLALRQIRLGGRSTVFCPSCQR